MRLRLGVPLWLDRSREQKRRTYPILGGTIRADVAVIGGGITGAGIAHAFAEAGVRGALLESDLVARGSTAASTALVMQETDEDFGGLERRYGRVGAERRTTARLSSSGRR